MDFRLMRPEDRNATFDVWHAARTARTGAPSQRRVERVLEKLRDSDTTVYIADDGRIVGMVATEAGRNDDGHGPVLPELMHISMVFVTPGSQRQGIGRGLLRHIFDAAVQAGLRSAALWTETTNAPARRLYETVGMTPTRERQVTDTMRWVRYEATLDP
jgi:ribosomal protein S18 acetylase RimI-like enzyme